MKTAQRVREFVSGSNADVFLRRDFHPFGGRSQVNVALKILIGQGLLVRLSSGVYARAKPSVLSGRPIPVKPLEVLAPKILERFGVEVHAPRLVREYNAGSTQVPVGVTLAIGSRRITRRIQFGGQRVEYVRD